MTVFFSIIYKTNLRWWKKFYIVAYTAVAESLINFEFMSFTCILLLKQKKINRNFSYLLFEGFFSRSAPEIRHSDTDSELW